MIGGGGFRPSFRQEGASPLLSRPFIFFDKMCLFDAQLQCLRRQVEAPQHPPSHSHHIISPQKGRFVASDPFCALFTLPHYPPLPLAFCILGTRGFHGINRPKSECSASSCPPLPSLSFSVSLFLFLFLFLYFLSPLSHSSLLFSFPSTNLFTSGLRVLFAPQRLRVDEDISVPVRSHRRSLFTLT